MHKLILFGAGGHAKSCIDIIHQQKKYYIDSVVDLPSTNQQKLFDYRVIKQEENLRKLHKISKYAAIGIGQISNSKIRKELFDKLKKNEFILPSFFSKQCYISKNSSISESTFVMNMAVINSETQIKSN